MQFDMVLRAFSEFFERDSVRYALIGGLACHAWGRVRPTKDADFAVDGHSQSRVIAFAESLGYRTIYKGEAFSNHEHPEPAWGQVDFMYLRGETARRVFGEAVLKQLLPDRGIPVASAGHLAMMKALAMKNFPHRALFEGEDIRILLKVPGIDRKAVRDYFASQGLLELFDAIERAN